jgi:TonB family protein
VLDLGEAKLRDEIRRVGMLEAPAPGHPAGWVDPIETPLDLGNLGSGLAGSAITPLEAVRLAALLAHGRLVTPHWIAQRFDPAHDRVEVPESMESPRVWEVEVADTLRGYLRKVTEDGTARRAFQRENGTPRLGPVGVAGKTGTLRGDDPEGLYQWFAGVAPDTAPTLAIAAVVVHPDTGPRAASASEIAAEVLERVFCDASTGCDPERADVLRERSAGRAQWVAHVRESAAASQAAAEAALADRDEREGRLDTPLRPLASTRLELPERLRRRRWEGEVMMRVDVGPEGEVLAAAVDASNLPPAFGEFLIAEVRTWRFNPPRRDGRPVSATALLPIPILVD